MATITGIHAGTTTITASYTIGNVTRTADAQITVSQGTAALTFEQASGTITYDGTRKSIGIVHYTGNGTAYYMVIKASSQPSTPAANASGWVEVTDGGTVYATGEGVASGAGTYYVFLKATAGTDYAAVDPKYGNNKVISKRTISVTTAPAYVTSTLKYTGSAQTLVQNNGASTSSVGVFYYYVNTTGTAPTTFSTASGSGWSTTRSKGTAVGSYYVWYYCYLSDTTNNTAGTNVNSIKALANSPKEIGKRTGAAPTFNNDSITATCVQAGTAVATNEAFDAATAGHSGTISYELRTVVKEGTSTTLSGWRVQSDSSRLISIPANTLPGTYLVTVRANEAETTTDTASYKDATITVVLSKGTQTLTLDTDTLTLTVPNTGTITASGYAGALTVTSSNTAIATASDAAASTITAVSAGSASATSGTATITFSAAATDYVESVTKTATVTVNKRQGAAPTFNTATLNSTLVQAGTSVTTTNAFSAATAKHSGTISYSIVGITKGGDTVSTSGWSITSGRKITSPNNTIYGTYLVTVRATESATATDTSSYTDKVMTVNLNRGTQTLNLDTDTLDLQVPNTGTITASGYAGTLSVTSGTTSVATASNTATSTITAVSAGTSTITFTADATNYVNSVSKTATVTVTRRSGATPTFNDTTAAATCVQSGAAVNTNAAFTAAEAGHGGSITYSIVGVVKDGTSTPLSDWTMTTNTSRIITVPQYTLPGTYLVTVRATEGETSTDTESYTDAVVTVTLSKGTQTLTLTNNPSNKTITYTGSLSTSTGTITASGHAGTISASSANTGYATVSTEGNVVTVQYVKNTTGVVITVTAGATDYVESVSKTVTWIMKRATGAAPTFNDSTAYATLSQDGSPKVTSTFTVATKGHNGSLSYTLVSITDSGGNTLTGWTLTSSTSRKFNVPENTPYGTYTATVTAKEAATNYYTESTKDATITITLNRGTQTLILDKDTLDLVVPNTGTITASGYAGALSVSSGTTAVATATNTATSTITAVTAGTSIITFTAGATDYVEEATATATVTVTRRTGAQPTFNNSTVTATCLQSQAAVTTSAFTAASPGHGGTITYSLVSASNSGGTTLNGWSVNSTNRTIGIPENTVSGTYTVVVKATEGETTTDGESEKNATITVTLSKGEQTLVLTGNPVDYTSTYNAGGTITASGHVGTINATSSNTSVATVSKNGSVVTVTCKKAGTTTITVTAAGNNYVNEVTQNVIWTINKASQAAPTATGATVAYNNTATATATGGGGHGTIEWSNGNEQTAIGSKTTTARWSGDDNYEPSPYSSSVTIEVIKYTPVVTLNVTSRAYNGNPLYATATVSYPEGGKTPNGTIYYGATQGAATYSVTYTGTTVNLSSISVTNYNESATVYAYFVPKSSGTGSCADVYNTSASVHETFSINGKAQATLPTTMVGGAANEGNVSYHNVARATVSKDATGGTLQYTTDNGSTWNTVTWISDSSNLTANPSRSSLGETTIKFRVLGDANHSNSNVSDPYTLTVYAATDANMDVDLATSLTYKTTGDHKQTIASVDTSDNTKYHGIGTYYLGYKIGSAANADGEITWSSSNTTPLQGMNAGKYYVYYKFTSDANHSNDKTYTLVGTVTISKATTSGAVSCNDTVYPNTVQASVSGNVEGGNVTWSITNGTGKANISNSGLVTPTQAGTVTVKATVAETANYNGYTATQKQITIGKANGSVSYSVITPIELWCTELPAPATSAVGNKEITIATSSASGTGTVSYSISQTGWVVSSNGQKVTISSGTAASTYNVTVWANVAEATNYTSASVSRSVSVQLKPVSLTSISLTLASDTIAFNGETTASVVAFFTNGSFGDVTSAVSFTTDPTGIVTIS